MKKNILSLVAFMAFSVSAFANTVEVKEEVVEDIGIPCVDAANAAQNAYQSAMKKFGIEASGLELFNVFQAALDICEQGCPV